MVETIPPDLQRLFLYFLWKGFRIPKHPAEYDNMPGGGGWEGYVIVYDIEDYL